MFLAWRGMLGLTDGAIPGRLSAVIRGAVCECSLAVFHFWSAADLPPGRRPRRVSSGRSAVL